MSDSRKVTMTLEREKGTLIHTCVDCELPAEVHGIYSLKENSDVAIDGWYCLSCWEDVLLVVDELHHEGFTGVNPQT